MASLELSDAGREHLIEVMTGETDGTDPRCLGCAEILRALGISPASVPVRPSAEQQLDRLLQACKQWKQATESRLKMLDSRGESAKAMLKPDADLIAVIEEMAGG